MKRESLNPRVRMNANARGYDHAYRKARLQVLERDRWTCNYCGKNLQGADATVDHIVALANGGDATSLLNLTASCRTCNSRKRDK